MTDTQEKDMYIEISKNGEMNNFENETNDEEMNDENFDDNVAKNHSIHTDTPMISRLNVGQLKSSTYQYTKGFNNENHESDIDGLSENYQDYQSADQNNQTSNYPSDMGRNNITIMEENTNIENDENSNVVYEQNILVSSRECSPDQVNDDSGEICVNHDEQEYDEDDERVMNVKSSPILQNIDSMKPINDLVKILGLNQDDDVSQGKIYHQLPKAVDRDAAKRLAKRLFECNGFKITDVAKHLSKRNDFSQIVGEEFANFFEFTDVRLDKALRQFLSKFTLVGETQERERIMHHFSRRFVNCNPNIYNGEDACHTLVCALIILNTNLHGQIHPKMSQMDFINNLRELNDREDFNSDNLKELFEAIETEPIRWPVDDELVNIVGLSKPDVVEASKQFISPPNFTTYTFDINPQDVNSRDFMSGRIVRKWLKEPGGRKTSFGKRGWRIYHARLRDLTIYLYKHCKISPPLTMNELTNTSDSMEKKRGSTKSLSRKSSGSGSKKSKQKSKDQPPIPAPSEPSITSETISKPVDNINCTLKSTESKDHPDIEVGDTWSDAIQKNEGDFIASGVVQDDQEKENTPEETISTLESQVTDLDDNQQLSDEVSQTSSIVNTTMTNQGAYIFQQQQLQYPQYSSLLNNINKVPAPLVTSSYPQPLTTNQPSPPSSFVLRPSNCEIYINHALATRADDYTKKKFVLRILTKYGSEYLFQVSTEKELECWIDNINYAAALLSDPEPIIGMSTMERMNSKSIPSPKITNLSMRDQLESHQKCILELQKAIANLKENPPKKNDRKMKQEIEESIRFRNQELTRYQTYCQLLENEMKKMIAFNHHAAAAAGASFIPGPFPYLQPTTSSNGRPGGNPQIIDPQLQYLQQAHSIMIGSFPNAQQLYLTNQNPVSIYSGGTTNPIISPSQGTFYIPPPQQQQPPPQQPNRIIRIPPNSIQSAHFSAANQVSIAANNKRVLRYYPRVNQNTNTITTPTSITPVTTIVLTNTQNTLDTTGIDQEALITNTTQTSTNIMYSTPQTISTSTEITNPKTTFYEIV